jgi:ribosomal protein L34E
MKPYGKPPKHQNKRHNSDKCPICSNSKDGVKKGRARRKTREEILERIMELTKDPKELYWEQL